MTRFFSHFLLPSLATFLRTARHRDSDDRERDYLWGTATWWPALCQRPPPDKAPLCSSGYGLTPPRKHSAARLSSIFVSLSLCLTPFLSSIKKITLQVLEKCVSLLSALRLSVWRSFYEATTASDHIIAR